MAPATLNQILSQLETLEPEELVKLNQTIQKHLADKNQLSAQAAFHQALLDSGLVKQIKRPCYEPISERRLFEVKGKPVSETIIEERR
ncbi:hypothetical protein RIVM261_027060 [Rivularia sp. IAM M-261]|nr:hypothetical protein RIVM261_027060 [Rivularia sp. IAM M-261]